MNVEQVAICLQRLFILCQILEEIQYYTTKKANKQSEDFKAMESVCRMFVQTRQREREREKRREREQERLTYPLRVSFPPGSLLDSCSTVFGQVTNLATFPADIAGERRGRKHPLRFIRVPLS